MKAIKVFFIIALFFVLSCNDDDFLTEKPKSIYTILNAFEKSSQVEAQLTMCYIKLYGFYGQSTNGWTTIYEFKSNGTDVLDAPYWRHGGTGGFSNFSTWSTTSSFVETVWNEMYQVVSYANLTLLGTEIENITWASEEYKTRLIAEARFFRGYSYLRLGELFGGVPLVDHFDEELRFDYTRSTREQTYQFAIDDLLYAFENLPQYPQEDGRIAQGAAGHILAEAYLAMGVETGDNSNYTSAINYANTTIALHPLMTERFGVRSNPNDNSTNRGVATYLPNGNVYGDLFYPGNYDYSAGNTEAVWTLQTPTYEQSDETGGQTSREPFIIGPVLRDISWKPEFVEPGSAAGPWKAVSAEYNTATFPAYLGGFGISEARVTQHASYGIWADSTDIRYEENVTVRTMYECTDPAHSMYGKKVPLTMLDPNPNVSSKYSPIFSKITPLDEWSYRSTDNLHIGYNHDNYGIRSAETYLLLAEAYLRSDQDGLAAEAINAVRERAHCSTMYSAGNIDINSILDERMRECLFEEGRWFTLLRMEPEVWKQRIYNHSMFIADYPNYSLPITWDLWPIPQNVIELNTDAEFPQNSGWGE